MERSTRQRVLDFCHWMREAHPDMVVLFTEGSCMHFHMALRSVFPGAVMWFNTDHVVTEIGDRFYDIRGDVTADVRLRVGAPDQYRRSASDERHGMSQKLRCNWPAGEIGASRKRITFKDDTTDRENEEGAR